LGSFLFGFCLGSVVANRTTNRCAGDTIMAGHVSRYSANRGAFNAAFGVRDSCNCGQRYS